MGVPSFEDSISLASDVSICFCLVMTSVAVSNCVGQLLLGVWLPVEAHEQVSAHKVDYKDFRRCVLPK